MSTSERAKGILAALSDAFKDPAGLTGAMATTYIQRQAGDDRPIDRWSWGNAVWAWYHKTDDARTFKQWQTAGRSVKKGSKAFYILGPCLIRKKRTDDNGEEKVSSILVGFKGIPVFPLEATDGEPLPPPPDYTPAQLPAFSGVAAAWGIPVSWHPSQARGTLGSYSITNKEIHLASYEESVYWHELGHAADDRAHGKLKGGQDPAQEAVAELVAAVLARMTGSKIDKAAWDYIASYAGDARAMLSKVLPRVEAALDLIFAAMPQEETG